MDIVRALIVRPYLAAGLAMALAGCQQNEPATLSYREQRAAEWQLVRSEVMQRAREHMDAGRYFEASAAIAPWRDVADGEARGLQNAASKLHATTAGQAPHEASQSAEGAEVAEPMRSAWAGTYSEVDRYLKQRAANPDSVELTHCTQAVRREQGWGTRCTWSVRNAFGAKQSSQGLFLIREGRATPID